jgi:hypothetical protein
LRLTEPTLQPLDKSVLARFIGEHVEDEHPQEQLLAAGVHRLVAPAM